MARILVLDAYAKAFLNFRGPFLEELVASGHEVVAAAPDADPDVQAVLRKMGVRSVRISLERTGVNPFSDARAFFGLVRAMRSVRPDVAIFYTSKAVIYGALAAWIAGVPRRYAMITGLGYGFVARSFRGRLISWMQRRLYRFSLPRCQVVLFQNPDDRDLFLSLGLTGSARLGIVNGSGVDVGHFAEAEQAGSQPAFLMIGRLLLSKGVREYLEAASILHGEFPEARFRLVGWLDRTNPDSISEEELQNLLRQGCVEYTGRLADVRPALCACSVFVLPSYREGTPRSVLEAMATGRAVVTTDAPGCRETVLDGATGYLVPVGNAAALADAMRRYACDPPLAEAHGRAGRRLAEAKYDVVKVNRAITELLSLRRGDP